MNRKLRGVISKYAPQKESQIENNPFLELSPNKIQNSPSISSLQRPPTANDEAYISIRTYTEYSKDNNVINQ